MTKNKKKKSRGVQASSSTSTTLPAELQSLMDQAASATSTNNTGTRTAADQEAELLHLSNQMETMMNLTRGEDVTTQPPTTSKSTLRQKIVEKKSNRQKGGTGKFSNKEASQSDKDDELRHRYRLFKASFPGGNPAMESLIFPNGVPQHIKDSTTLKYCMRQMTEEEEEELLTSKMKKTTKFLEEEEQFILANLTGRISKLPLDIIFNILSRVPVKSLSDCRWVSKSWFKIIRHPLFAESQHSRAAQSFSPCVSYFNLTLKTFYLVDHQVFDSHKASTKVYHPDISGFGWAYDVVGACNGLICMSPDPECYEPQPYFIFNPITRESIKLPESPNHTFAPTAAGFGYDPITSQYKVVHIMGSREVEIFTLGSARWRRIGDVPYDFRYRSVFVSGALHWRIYKEEEMRFSVIALDMFSERFREVPPPPCAGPTKTRFAVKNLGALGGSLCFIDDDFDGYYEIWAMRSYGGKGSWFKEYVLKKENFPLGYWMGEYEVVKLRNGELLLKHDQKRVKHEYEKHLLHYYDPKTKTFERIVTTGIDSGALHLLPIIHVGSLISPKNLCLSTRSSCTINNTLEASLLPPMNVPIVSAQFAMRDVEVATNLRSVKYVRHYVYEGHDPTIITLAETDVSQEFLQRYNFAIDTFDLLREGAM